MYPFSIRETEVPGDIFGRVDGVIVFGIDMSSYDVAGFRRCLEVSNDMMHKVLSIFVAILGCFSMPSRQDGFIVPLRSLYARHPAASDLLLGWLSQAVVS